jgi:hypothetical protein
MKIFSITYTKISNYQKNRPEPINMGPLGGEGSRRMLDGG